MHTAPANLGTHICVPKALMRPLTDDLMFQQYQTLGLQRDGGGRTLATVSGPTQL